MQIRFDKTKKEEKDLVLEENVPVMVEENTYVYFMTNDWTVVVEKLKKLGCKRPTKKDFKESRLHRNVRKKMAQIKASWSIAATKEYEVLNYYDVESDKAFFVVLNQFRTEQKPLAQMIEIICSEDKEKIIQFAKKGLDIEQRFEYGLSFLMLAANYNKYESIKTLIEVGADVNARDVDGLTPLMHAVASNALESVKLLLQNKKIDIDAADCNGQTALIIAAYYGYIDILKLLIKVGANVNYSSLLGEIALHESILNNKYEAAIILMEAGADLNKADVKGNTPFLDAVKVDNVLIESELIKRGVRLSNEDKEKFAAMAACNNSKKTFNYLIDNEFFSDREIQFGIALSIAFNHIDCAVSLIRKSEDAHKSVLTAFCFSCATNMTVIVDKFIDDLSFINELSLFDMTPLMCACYCSSEDVARKLIERGAEINLTNKSGKTALMYAAGCENAKVVRLLIQNGAEKSVKDKDGNDYEYYARNPEKRSFTDILFEKLTLKKEDAGKKRKGNIPLERQSFIDRFNWYLQRYFEHYPNNKTSDIYTPVRLSKQTFSKINSNRDSSFHPRKKNVLLLAAGLKLTQRETEDLLQSAGYSFDENDIKDTIVKKFLSIQNWNILDWNIELYRKTGKVMFK